MPHTAIVSDLRKVFNEPFSWRTHVRLYKQTLPGLYAFSTDSARGRRSSTPDAPSGPVPSSPPGACCSWRQPTTTASARSMRATPLTYQGKDGKQYVAVVATDT